MDDLVKKIFIWTLFFILRFALWFRYRVTVKGLDQINPATLNKPGGVLFLPNHPTIFVDPVLVAMWAYTKYPIRPMVTEYMYYHPVNHWIMKQIKALPIPSFISSRNSFKTRKNEKAFEAAIEGLKKGENFIVYPAGRVKSQAREVINTSGVHRIIQAVPEANVVLVRTIGLWGSSFSRALTGRTAQMTPTIWNGIKIAFKNLLFFSPRREVIIEFVPVGRDFPYKSSRIELNRYLEKWYNRPDGLSPALSPEPGDTLRLVPYSIWSNALPVPFKADTIEDANIDLKKIPSDLQEKIKLKLSEMSQVPIENIQPEMDLGSELGLDSLDQAELVAFIDDTFDIKGIPVAELKTVKRVLGIASKQITFQPEEEEEEKDIKKWFETRSHERIKIPEGNTIPEVFLNKCDEMGHKICCGDSRSGILTYSQLKMRAILLAEKIRQLPGEYIGILLPASSAAYVVVFGCQLAGKIPLMINWTTGSRHLESVKALSNVQVVLTSWAFLERLDNVDLNGLEDSILTLEDLRRTIKLKDKLKALYLSKLKTPTICRHFGIQNTKKSSQAVLLFTSGTESMPKGVPLTHENILTNIRDATNGVEVFQDDTLLGILPPFHAFGFTVTGLLPILAGCKIAFFPNPTDGFGVAKAVEKWKATVICGTPAFLKNMFKAASPEMLKSLRIFATGAEKAPQDLFDMVKRLKNGQIIEGYGITECAPVLTFNRVNTPPKGVGKPFENVSLKIVDLATHHTVPAGKQGLILAKGKNIFPGYINPDVKSPFIEVEGESWYSTGDLGHLDTEGNLYISGRLKRFVKLGGEMISLAAIEEVLKEKIGNAQKQSEDDEANLAMCAKEKEGEKPIFYLFACFPTNLEEVNRSLKEAGFSNLIKVSQVQRIPEIPILGSGKINYRALDSLIPSNHS